MRVAIIGMGTAGVSVLRELVKHPKFNQLDIDLYDDKVNMGQGVPFQPSRTIPSSISIDKRWTPRLTPIPISIVSLSQRDRR